MSNDAAAGNDTGGSSCGCAAEEDAGAALASAENGGDREGSLQGETSAPTDLNEILNAHQYFDEESPSLMLSPDAHVRLAWDLFLVLLVLYSAFFIPLEERCSLHDR